MEICPLLQVSVFYLFIMEGLNDVNLKRGIGDSYSRLKSKVQKCSEDMMLMKEENAELKKFKEEITLKQAVGEEESCYCTAVNVHSNAKGTGV